MLKVKRVHLWYVISFLLATNVFTLGTLLWHWNAVGTAAFSLFIFFLGLFFSGMFVKIKPGELDI